MKLTAKLAYSQIITNRSRAIWTLLGIALSTAMITAVYGFAASGHAVLMEAAGGNEFYINSYNKTIFGLGSFLSVVIITASVIVVSNSFRVSAGERTQQFGILKSVGATKKQIINTIMYEGIYLCAAAIPVGIIIGLLVNLAGLKIVNYFLAEINALNIDNPLELGFVFAWQAIILSIIVSGITVWLSAWLPARKASKIAAIDAIRRAGDIKVNSKHVRSSWLIGKLFGFEGTLASKSLKRSKRNFRATVISLTVSIIMFIIVGAFGRQMEIATSIFDPDLDVSVWALFHLMDSSLQSCYIDSEMGEQVTERLRETNEDVFGIGFDYHYHFADISKEMLTPKMLEAIGSNENDLGKTEYELSVALIVIDTVNYAALCERAGVPIGSNILVNRYTWYHDRGREVFKPYEYNTQTLLIKKERSDVHDRYELPLHGELTGLDIPGEVSYSIGGASVIVIVPSLENIPRYCWFANPNDKTGFIEHTNIVLNEYFSFGGEESILLKVNDIEAEAKAQRRVAHLLMVFIYGFVGMLTLIGLTNVISTISTNVRSRGREFAVLQSVGMSYSGLNRMLNLESILCSIKALALGLPLGIIGSYISYRSVEMPVEFPYTLPWLPITQCTLGVLVITWVIMRYAATRLRGGNIVETIRLGNGMT